MSSKLSKRRATVRKPKICAGASCPPPPPPPAWPPDTFPIHFEYTYSFEGEPGTGEWTIPCTRDPGTWDWFGFGAPPENAVAEWRVNVPTKTAYLYIAGFNPDIGNYDCDKDFIPVIWNTSTLYTISTWDMIQAIDSGLAEFTF